MVSIFGFRDHANRSLDPPSRKSTSQKYTFGRVTLTPVSATPYEIRRQGGEICIQMEPLDFSESQEMRRNL